MTKSYDEFCPVALGLDVLGDRWTLLILRDLAWYGPARFKDFEYHNPGMSTALLSARLKQMRANGVVSKEGDLYRLVDSSGKVRAVIDSIASFGMEHVPQAQITMQRLTYIARRRTADHLRRLEALDRMTVTLEIGNMVVDLGVGDGTVEFSEGESQPSISLDAQEFSALIAGEASTLPGLPASHLRALQPA